MKVFCAICVGLSIALFTGAADTRAQNPVDAEIVKLNGELSRTFKSGNYAQALIAAERLVELNTQKYGKKHLVLARSLANLGFVENALGDVKKAKKSLDEAQDIFNDQKDLSKEDGSRFASVLEILARYKMMVLTSSGEDYLQQALKLREKSSGTEDAKLAVPLTGLANISFWNHDYKGAAETYRRLLFLLVKTSTDLSRDDVAAVFARTRCSYRKAKIEDRFAEVESDYQILINALSNAVKREVTVAGKVVNGKATHLQKPTFPAEAKKASTDGTVHVDVLINETGDVISACSEAGANIFLGDSAENAAYASKFSPTLLNGSPVKVSGVITYKFIL